MARWVCAFCNHPQVFNEKNSHSKENHLFLGHNPSALTCILFAVRCLNEECNKTSLQLSVHKYVGADYEKLGIRYDAWQLWPNATYKTQPAFIPEPIREDYYEACLIRNQSPKSSATLARRCLQGMIRDFCGISESRLVDEIRKLKAAVDAGTAPPGVTPETIDAIDSVRSIGNIGAHMERDINVIVDVDPDEAQMLIELIELLLEEWYVARAKRAERLARVTALSAAKKAEIEQARVAQLPEPGKA